VFRDHEIQSKNAVQDKFRDIDVSLQCSRVQCKQVCSNVKCLIAHLKEHIEDGTEIKCPSNACTKSFSKKSSFTSHLSRYHRNFCIDHLASEYVIGPQNNSGTGQPVQNENFGVFPDSPELGPIVDNDVMSETGHFEVGSDTDLTEEMEGIEGLYLRNLALFYLKLQPKYLLPSSTIQHIIEEFQDVHRLGQSYLCDQVISKLKNETIPEEKLKEIAELFSKSDLFTHCNANELSTDYKRKSTFKKMFDYVPPVTVTLGTNETGKKRSFQYVPVNESLECLNRNKSAQDEFELTRVPPFHDISEATDCLCDITDRKVFKSNRLFQEDPNSLKLILYQDAFEVCNPLGSSKKKHKVLAVYLTLGDFRPHLRSNIDHTLLVLLCTETDMKYFGQDAIFGPLIKDLKDLETSGIQLGEQNVRGTLCCITGDNLGSHCIGGFTENFSTVNHMCRYCLIEKSSFLEDPCQVGPRRAIEKYREDINSLTEELNNSRGVKFDSKFNDLSYFHVCQPGLPPCLGHDLFEGIVNYDVAIFLQNLIKVKKWLTYEDINRRISGFKYLGADASSQPCVVNCQGTKLGGQAAENWCLIRLLPVIIHEKVKDANDPVWQVLLLLRDIVELICAPKISEADVCYLNLLIDEYLQSRQDLFPECGLKPKHHYLKHYPRLILEFGPLIRLWTMTFERKHSYFKRSQNFKNLNLTLSERHQLLQAYKGAGSFFPNSLEEVSSTPFYPDTYSQEIQSTLVNFSFNADDTQVGYEVNSKGTKYKKGSFVVIGKIEDVLLFGEILFMLTSSKHRPSEIGSGLYFLVKVHQSVFNHDFHVYQTTDLHPQKTIYRCIQDSDLLDYYPLVAYKKNGTLIIPLKHSIHVPHVL
jgi:hypothetical protein